MIGVPITWIEWIEWGERGGGGGDAIISKWGLGGFNLFGIERALYTRTLRFSCRDSRWNMMNFNFVNGIEGMDADRCRYLNFTYRKLNL